MSKNRIYSTEENLFGYVTRHFQERASSMSKHETIAIRSAHIDVFGTVFNYTCTYSDGSVEARTAGFNHEGRCLFDMILASRL